MLAVLADQKNGKEYYISLMDTFTFEENEYTVMYNYEPDDGNHGEPEIVIMRSYRDADGEQYFTSIRDEKELEIVFELFYERFSREMRSS